MTLEEAIGATAELCGTQLSRPAARMLLADLSEYPEDAILGALAKCRREHKGRLTVAEIVSRIDDGRPGPDEAWSMLVWNEDQTVVLTEEMQYAQGPLWGMYDAGDRVGARMAFKEAYTRLVNEAREAKKQVEWQVSLGQDRSGRRDVILRAMSEGKLTPAQGQRFIPPDEGPDRRTGGGLTRIGR